MSPTKEDFKAVIRPVLLCNTPRSLYEALFRTEIYSQAKKCTERELSDTYDHLTSKACMTPLSAAIGYIILMASVSMGVDGLHLDPERLIWGKRIADYALADRNTTTEVIIKPTAPKPDTPAILISSSDASVGSTPLILVSTESADPNRKIII